MVLNEFFRYYIPIYTQCHARVCDCISYYDMLDRRALGSPPILGIMYIKHTEFISDAPFGPPQSCLRSSYMYALHVDEARFTVKPYLFTAVFYSLRCRHMHNSRDIPMCHSSVTILRTFHNSPKRQRFFKSVLDVYISEPHVK